MTQKNYLDESYNGSLINMNQGAAYYCYTIYDPWADQYYSGSRGVEGTDVHDLLKQYFTSSTVIDFVARLKQNPTAFLFRVEYFDTRQKAFDAEKRFHWAHDVGKNSRFYNVIKAGGTYCGSGTVHCKRSDGTMYRVSCREYASGLHQSVTANTMNARTTDGSMVKINCDDFDPNVHTTQFKDHVLAKNVTTGVTCRVHRDVFVADPDVVGITVGYVTAIDVNTNEIVHVAKEEFDANDNYVGVSTGTVPVIDIATGSTIVIRCEDYDRSKHRHSNADTVVVYSLGERKTVKIACSEYHANPNKYANMSTKIFYVIDGIFFKSKKLASDHYIGTRGRGFLHIKQHDISKKFSDITIITREEHQNAKD